tara:strand:- start:277 stop:654 length:378 start_codon:yes stop_codon:yes gene_type:complete
MEYASLGLAGLIGYMLGWFLANIMHLGRTGLMVEKVGLQTLKLMVGVAQDIEFIRAIKYRIAEDEFGDSATAIRQRNVDDYEYEKWKRSAVDTFLTAYPVVFRRQVPFTDWDSAVKHFENNRGKL